jgi:Tfp pilus assembly protein PilE
MASNRGTFMQKRNGQAGLTMIGFLFVAAVVVVIALIGFRVLPSYMEYFSVKKAVAGALEDAVDGQPATVRRFFERRVGAEYIDSIDWRNLEVTKQNNQIVASISWEKRMPLVYNISLLLDFEVTEAR